MSGRNLPWPASDERHAITALPTRALHAAQAAGAAAIPRSVVTSENHQCAFVEVELFQLREHFTDARVEVAHHVAVKAGAALLVKLFRRGERFMGHGVGEVKEERP